jgi:hypothetical protein
MKAQMFLQTIIIIIILFLATALHSLVSPAPAALPPLSHVLLFEQDFICKYSNNSSPLPFCAGFHTRTPHTHNNYIAEIQ